MSEHTGSERRIVVGVDGSPSSNQALQWAIGQANLTGAAVDAIACWHPTTLYDWTLHAKDPHQDAAARQTLAATVADALQDAPAVQVRQSALPGNAAEVLVERSRNADLLVVGSRGHGGFSGVLLGSTSHNCVQHAHCPVVVVRGAGA
jgi:nucleotide-binding universal stress UspA family protein